MLARREDTVYIGNTENLIRCSKPGPKPYSPRQMKRTAMTALRRDLARYVAWHACESTVPLKRLRTLAVTGACLYEQKWSFVIRGQRGYKELISALKLAKLIGTGFHRLQIIALHL